MNEATQRLIDLYRETRDEVWLTQAALNCIHSDEPLPGGILSYINVLLLQREKKLSVQLKKRDTLNHNEWYLREVRDLIFLTGTDLEDACLRVSNANKELHGSRKKVPADSTLKRLWDNRDARWKKDPVIKVSYDWAMEWFGEYCKPEYGLDGIQIEIKRDIFV